MELTKQEKEILKGLVSLELKKIHEAKKDMKELRPSVAFIAVEEKYDEVLESLIKKLE